MPKKKRGRGRPKGSTKDVPHNEAWWRWTFLNPDEVTAFIERGDERQHSDMKNLLEHWKVKEPEFFEKINGKQY